MPELFNPQAFEKLAEAEAAHWWFRPRNRLLTWALREKVGSFRNFLEVGCGTGFVLSGIHDAFPEVSLKGSEFFPEGLAFARDRIPTASFEQLDARKFEETGTYDVIGAFDVVEHIPEDELVLQNLGNGLRKGGHLILTVPQHRWLWSVVDEVACHVRRYSRSELCQKVESAGLKVTYVTSFVSLLVPLMYLARLRAQNKDYDPMSEFQIPTWMNWMLEQVMRVEHFLLKTGMSLPVGGSLLVLAQKS